MVQLSIVIPKSSCAEQFEATLASVLRNRPENCEILVVTPGVYDDPYELAEEVRFLTTRPDSGILDLINTGFRYAQAEILNLLLCGVEVQEGWTGPALQQFQDPSVGSVSPLIESPLGRVAAAGVRRGMAHTRKLAAAGKRLPRRRRMAARIVGPTLTAGFYRKLALADVRGIDAKLGLPLVDLDLGLSMAKAGYEARFEPSSRVNAELDNRRNPGSLSDATMHELLVWKHCHSVTSGLGHFFSIAVEFLANLARGSAVPILAGRVWGMVRAVLERSRNRQVSSQKALEGWTTETTRQDGPHGPRPASTKVSAARIEHPVM